MISAYDRPVMQALGRRLEQAIETVESDPPTDVSIAVHLSGKLGRAINPNVVGKWRRGMQEPTLAEIKALADMLDVDPAWLAFGHGVP